MAEVTVRRNLELLACVTRRGHIRGARDRPNPPKGAFTAPRGALSNLRQNGQNRPYTRMRSSLPDTFGAIWMARCGVRGGEALS